MKILHVITGLPMAGAQMALYRLLTDIDRERFDCCVISLMDRGPVGKMIEDLGVPVHSLNMERGIPTPGVGRRFIRLVRSVPAPDVIQGWEYHGNMASSAARCLLRGRPAVVWNVRHTPIQLSDEKRLTAWIIRAGKWISNYVDGIIYNAEASRSVHERLGYKRSVGLVLDNGFDLGQTLSSSETRHTIRMEIGLAPDVPVIALIARFHPMKDHATFLSAAGLLLKKHPDVQFVLSGEKVDADNVYLCDLIAKSGLEQRVHLLGERQDVSRLLTAIDILALTSAWGEGFPNIVGEAMACGVPCVVTGIGDSARVVGMTGFVVRPKDPGALVDAWDRILSLPVDERRALGVKARCRIEENYSLGRMVQAYESLYESIGNNKK